MRMLTILVLVGLEAWILWAAPRPAPGHPPSPSMGTAASPDRWIAATPSPRYAPFSDHVVGAKEAGKGRRIDVHRLLAEVERIRGLKFKRDVPAYTQTIDQARAYLARELEEDAHWQADQAFVEQFGFVKPGFDLHHFLLDFYAEQVAGYYDYKTAAFYMSPHALEGDPSMALVQGLGMGRAVEDSLVVHEMDHAMQDQYFSIKRLQALSKGALHDDRALAVQSLLEGDAYLVMMYSMLASMGVDSSAPIASTLDPDGLGSGMSGAVSGRAPLYVRKLALFPYIQGALFINYYKEKGGWSAVNALYAHPPRSSEQIIHPEKYESGDNPVPLRIPPEADVPCIAENIMGEERMRLWWDQWLPHDGDRAMASDGWGGDVYRIYPGHAMLWVTVWDDRMSARRFVSAARRVLEAKNRIRFAEPAGARATSKERRGQTWSARHGDRLSAIEWRGESVVVVDNVPRDRLARLLQLGRQTVERAHR
jgi:hypothetical protein